MIRPKLNYGNVMATIAVFLALGGTALAANQLAKNSVGSKQLKKNSVTAKKIKKNAVTAAKIKKDAVTTAKLKDGSVSGAKIDAADAPFSYISNRIRTTAQAPFTVGTVYPIGSYTQPAGQDNQYLGGLDLSIPAECAPPRTLMAYLVLDGSDPATIDPVRTVAVGTVTDSTSVAVSKRLEFAPYPFLYSPMARIGEASDVPHTFTALLAQAECSGGGGGVTVTGGGIDVIGTR